MNALVFCVGCGLEIPAAAQFCTSCGDRQPLEEWTPTVRLELDPTRAAFVGLSGPPAESNGNALLAKGRMAEMRPEDEPVKANGPRSEPSGGPIELGSEAARAVVEKFETSVPQVGCVACQEPLDAEARFCTSCGVARAQAEPAPVAAEDADRCVSCGDRMVATAQFCTGCGAGRPASAATVAPPAKAHAEAVHPPASTFGATTAAGAPPSLEVAQTPVQPTIEEDCVAMSGYCEQCGTELSPDARFCKSCAHPVAHQAQAVEAASTAPTADRDAVAGINAIGESPGPDRSPPPYSPPADAPFVSGAPPAPYLRPEVPPAPARVLVAQPDNRGLSQAMLLSQQKSTGAAVLLSFFIPGLGQFYAGSIGKGIMFLIGTVINIVLMLVLIGFVLQFLWWIFSMVDANSTASAHNMRLMAAAAA